MNVDFLLVALVIALVIPWVARIWLKSRLTYTEVAAQMGVVLLVVGIVFGFGLVGKTWDTEILNGEITGKESRHVSCSHDYKCRCHDVKTESCSTDSNGKRSCTTSHHEECDTCYEHSYDVSWFVDTNINGEFTVDRIDRRGLGEPPRWTLFKLGQPFSTTHQYTNYIQAVDASVFNFSFIGQQFVPLIPQYPLNIYDYQYIDRVFAKGVNVPDLREWNYGIGLITKNLGPKKQVNVIIIFVNTTDHAYMQALRSAWLGGKKNDIVVVIATPKYPEIAWVDVLSWSDSELFKVELKDAIHDLETVDRAKILTLIHDKTLSSFQRKQMRDFKYLEWEIQPSDGVMWFAIILALIGSIGLTWFFSKQDVDFTIMDLFNRNYYRRRRY